jgi:hypothetical protein
MGGCLRVRVLESLDGVKEKKKKTQMITEKMVSAEYRLWHEPKDKVYLVPA